MSLHLEKAPTLAAPKGPLAIIVLDGVGVGRHDEGDAVWLARTPTLDRLDRVALKTTLLAHGTHVGMPSDDDMGNSEVGHNALGAGRIFEQGASLVETAINTGRLFESDVWLEAVSRTVAAKPGTLHLLGLLSDGNVHSHIDHLFAMIRHAHQDGIERLRVHILLDGRDVGSFTALDYVAPLEALLAEVSAKPARDYRIASGGGRMFVTMDRYESDWAVVERGWRAHVLGEGPQFESATAAILAARAETKDLSDQFLPPFVVVERDAAGQVVPVGAVEDGDSFFLFNFRGDRAIQISKAFENDDFPAFDRVRRPNVLYAGMMQYDGDLKLPHRFLVTPPHIDRTMGEYLSAAGLKQLAVAETQKFGHVTYFWNGNRSGCFDDALERAIEVPSDRVEFSERPWMKAAEVTDTIIAELQSGHWDLVRINYANGDMVGHTGHREAAIIAVESVDLCLERLLEVIEALGGAAIITADHGNADQMIQIDKKTKDFARYPDGRPMELTSHTLNPVPLWIFDPHRVGLFVLDEGLAQRRLSNVAATALMMLGYEAPQGYDPSLVKRA